MHLPLKIIRDSRTGGRERYEAAHILIRPDQFVAWAGSDAPRRRSSHSAESDRLA